MYHTLDKKMEHSFNDNIYKYKYIKYKQKYLNLLDNKNNQSGGSPPYFGNNIHIFIIANITDENILREIRHTAHILSPKSHTDPHFSLLELHINYDDPHFQKLHERGDNLLKDKYLGDNIKKIFNNYLNGIRYIENAETPYGYVGMTDTKFFAKFYEIYPKKVILKYNDLLMQVLNLFATKLGIVENIVKGDSNNPMYHIFGYNSYDGFKSLFALTQFYAVSENVHPHISIVSSKDIQRTNKNLYDLIDHNEKALEILLSILRTHDTKKHSYLREIIPKKSIKQLTISIKSEKDDPNSSHKKKQFQQLKLRLKY